MDERTMHQKGAPSRDEFKHRHKTLCRQFYACDLDFVFVEKVPTPDIVAAIDYKTSSDAITFTEVIAYNALTRRGIPVFVVSGDVETGAFTISKYIGGHHGQPRYELKQVTTTSGWLEFEAWEKSVRDTHRKRFNP